MADDTNTAGREAIIRAAVAAMPHIDPLVADDLLDGVTMRTEADDIVAIFQAGRASLAASAGSEPVAAAAQSALETLERTHQSLARQLDLIAERAPGNFLDKRPVVSTLTMHQKRTEAAAAALRTALESHPSPPEGMAGWKPIATAPKDGTLILVHFKSKGVRAVSWDSPFHDEVTEENGIWCVDDDKHGPYGLRGYNDDGPTAPTHWMPLPAPPLPASEAKEL